MSKCENCGQPAFRKVNREEKQNWGFNGVCGILEPHFGNCVFEL